MFKALRSAADNITRRLPASLHFLLIQPFSQRAKFWRTIRYHSGLYGDLGKQFAGLHLGSGNARIEGFCNIDGNPLVQSDLVSGLDRLKLNADSVDIIYASHVFEHIPRARTLVTLLEWWRVLKPGGQLCLCVPDIEKLFTVYLENLPRYETEEGRAAVELACGVTYGGQVDRYDFHFYGYSFVTLRDLLERAGFANVRLFQRDELGFTTPVDGSTASISGTSVSLNVRADKKTDTSGGL